MKKIFYVFAALAVMAAACTKPEPITPSITLTSQAEVGVPVDGSTETVTFEANVPWTASLDNSNWTITPSSGEAGTVSVKVSSTPNATNDPVYATLTIKAQTATQTVKFIQVQKDGMVISTTEYEAPAEASTVTVKVMANVAVKATTSTAWITIPEPTKGLVEKDFALAIAANKGEAREGTVVFEGAGTPVEVTIKQAAFVPSFEVDCLEFDVPKKGGEYTINVTSNVEWTMKDYNDDTQPFLKAEATMDGFNATVKVTIAENGDDPRNPYVKFTVPEIQDPDIDEETGEPTGGTKDHVVRVYFHQEGLIQKAWTTALPEASRDGGKVSIARSGDSYVLLDGISAYMFNPASGEIIDAAQTLKTAAVKAAHKSGKLLSLTKAGEDLLPTQILNDDIDNFIIVLGGAYDTECLIFAVPAGTQITDTIEPDLLIACYMDYYSSGFGNFAVRGDVYGDATITAMACAGGSYEVANAGAYWEIKDGEAAWDAYGEAGEAAQPEYIEIYPDIEDVNEHTFWISTRAAFAPLGTTAADGFLFCGYDDAYEVRYFKGGDYMTVGTMGDWSAGVYCIQSGKWGNKNIVALASISLFPVWAIPTNVAIFDVADMSTPLALLSIEAPDYDNFVPAPGANTWMSEPTIGLKFEQKGDALVVYTADGAQGVITKHIINAK